MKQVIINSIVLLFFFQVNGLSLTDSLLYNIEHFTDEHGLPQNSINGIGVDEYGFIWLATEGGPVRYDGRSFKVYNTDEFGLNSKRIAYLSYDYQSKRLSALSSLAEKFPLIRGRPWHIDSTLAHLDEIPEIDQVPRYAIGLPPYYPQLGFEKYQIDARNGGNFIISYDSIYHYDHTHKIQSRIAFSHNDFFRFFLLDQELFHLTSIGQGYQFELDGTIKKLTIQGDLIKDRKDLEKVKLFWNIATGEVFMYVDRSFYTVAFSKNNKVLQTTLILDEFDFDTQNIFSAHYDKINKRIFLGSKTNGLFVLTRKKFRTMSGGNLLEEHMFYGQAPYGKDKVLTSQGYIFSDTGMVEIHPQIKEATQDRRTMLRDSKGFFWTTSSWKSLYKFNPDLDKIVFYREMPDPISCIHEGRNGEIWLGTYSGRVFAYQPERDTFRLLHKTDNEIVCIHQSAVDTMLVGTLQAGVLRLHIPSGKVDSLPGLTKKSIRSIYQDNTGNLWVTTYNDGFFLHTKNKSIQFPIDRYGHLRSSHCILEDNSGFFWISTNNGLFQVKKQQLLDYTSDTTAVPHYLYYDKASGFNTNEFNGGCQPCAVKTGNGYFSFPSMNGVVWFRPEEISPEVPDQKIIFDNFIVDGNSKSLSDTMVVEHGFKQIKIDIATAFFGNLYNLNLEYKINHENTDDSQWFPLENEAIFLNDLRSGTHQIAIRQTNIFEPQRYNYANIFIAVPPFFYETWSFFVLCLLAIIVSFWIFNMWRSRRVRVKNLLLQQKVNSQTRSLKESVSELEKSESSLIKQTNLLQHLSAAISHDINSPLTFVVQSLNTISGELKEENHPLSNYVQTTYLSVLQVYQYVKKLTSQTNLNLSNRNPELKTITLYDFIQKRIEFFTPLANEKQNQLVNSIDPEYKLYTNPDLLTVVVHNLIDNANNNCSSGIINVYLNIKKEGIYICIADTGTGMDPQQVEAINSGAPVTVVESGLGLQLVQYITTILDCKFTVRSQIAKGTITSLFFSRESYTK